MTALLIQALIARPAASQSIGQRSCVVTQPPDSTIPDIASVAQRFYLSGDTGAVCRVSFRVSFDSGGTWLTPTTETARGAGTITIAEPGHLYTVLWEFGRQGIREAPSKEAVRVEVKAEPVRAEQTTPANKQAQRSGGATPPAAGPNKEAADAIVSAGGFVSITPERENTSLSGHMGGFQLGVTPFNRSSWGIRMDALLTVPPLNKSVTITTVNGQLVGADSINENTDVVIVGSVFRRFALGNSVAMRLSAGAGVDIGNFEFLSGGTSDYAMPVVTAGVDVAFPISSGLSFVAGVQPLWRTQESEHLRRASARMVLGLEYAFR